MAQFNTLQSPKSSHFFDSKDTESDALSQPNAGAAQSCADYSLALVKSSSSQSMHWEDNTRQVEQPIGLPTPHFHSSESPYSHHEFSRFRSGINNSCLRGTGINEGMMDPSLACASANCQHDRLNMITPPPSDGSGPRSPPWEMMYQTQLPINIPHPARHEYYETAIRSNSPVQRIDGVRKKNAKFEIPEDHNLENLDTLIATAPDELKRKEFKMQKRLLRNREAALHSRQKKKAYTEELEVENNRLKDIIHALENEREATQMRKKSYENDKDESHHKTAQWEQRTRRLISEKEAQAKEISKLRSQISLLQESLASAQNSPWSSVPSSAVFSNFGSDISNVSIDIPDWGTSLDFNDDYCLDPHKLQQRSDTHNKDGLSHRSS